MCSVAVAWIMNRSAKGQSKASALICAVSLTQGKSKRCGFSAEVKLNLGKFDVQPAQAAELLVLRHKIY